MFKLVTRTAIAVVLLPSLSLADTLEGVWQHEDDPVWIQMQPGKGLATILRNDNKPDSAGFQLVRGLQSEASDGLQWTGEVYAAALGKYKDAEITLVEPDVMRFKVKVGFISRSVTWQRIAALPDKTLPEKALPEKASPEK